MPHKSNYIYGQIMGLNSEYWTQGTDLLGLTAENIVISRIVRGLHRFFKKEHIKDPIRRTALRCALVPDLVEKYFPRLDKKNVKLALEAVLNYVNDQELKGHRVGFNRHDPRKWKDTNGQPITKKELKQGSIVKPYITADGTFAQGVVDPGVIKQRSFHFRRSKLRKMFKKYVQRKRKEGFFQAKGVGYVVESGKVLSLGTNADKLAKKDVNWLRELWREP